MWDKIFTYELFHFMKYVEKHVDEDGNETNEPAEDDEVLAHFENHVKQVSSVKKVVVIATMWKTYDDIKQANIAIEEVGFIHASRFVKMMDYLSNKFMKGSLR
ncbi:hypothetical protein PQE75_gp079 [Bacillus phage vB_BcoS-136]|uniref:Uncharacterized protein n=1 Tax=Bacillus phage vB_BcoS-136 TaxID=2419619 RepID=A0A3G3BVN1_9CAUD|nr:hypothetical protein PQE75_gp079 [Bacillus phage vB_BcoS-136]AYP68211.1 hypothetical protein vBBcoS136_00079 [Bacillus phage vB_BcoS-136]